MPLTQRLLACLFGICAAASYAEDIRFVGETLLYDQNSKTVTISDRVELETEIGYFYLDTLVYDLQSGDITIDGALQARLDSEERLTAEYARLNKNDQGIILENVRMFIGKSMQITAARLENTPKWALGEYVLATSCYVGDDDPIPFWGVRAEEVYRDKEAQKIYFKNAKLDFWGVPILYLPRMRIPEPDVPRMSGFLSPEFVVSNLYGSGLRVPYFFTLGDYSDLLVSAYLTTKGLEIAEARYRKNWADFSIYSEGAEALDDGTGQSGRYYLMNRFFGNLPYGYTLDGALTLQSDYDFAPEFDYSDPETDYLRLRFQNVYTDFVVRMEQYRPLSEARKVTDDNPHILPELDYRRYGTVVLAYWMPILIC